MSKLGQAIRRRAVFAPAAPAAPAPVVSLGTGNAIQLRANAECFSGVRFENGGSEFGATNSGAFTNSRGSWLTSGNAADVWIERVINSGAALGWNDPGAGRLNMASTRSFGNSDNVSGDGSVTTNVTFNAYDAASGGNLLDTVTYNITSERTDI